MTKPQRRDVAELREKFGSQRRQAQREAEAKRAAQRRKQREMVITGAVWACAAVLLIGALLAQVVVSTTQSEHQEALEERAVAVTQAQSRLESAEDGEAFLPDDVRAGRWLNQADDAGERIAEIQNVYLQHTGPLSIENVEVYDEDAPAHLDEERLDEEGWRLSEDERFEIAEQRRSQAVSGLLRQLQPYFDAESRTEEDDRFNAVTRWDESVGTVDDQGDEVSLAHYEWTYHDAIIYSQDGRVESVWLLHDTESGELVAWVLGEFNPQSRVMQNLSIGYAEGYQQ